MAQPRDGHADEGGRQVRVGQHDEHDARLHGNQHDAAGDRRDTVYGRRLCRSKVLKLRNRIVLTISAAGSEHHRQRRQRGAVIGQPPGIREHGRGDTPRRRGSACRRSTACRRPWPLWMIEARQPHRGGGDEQEAGGPAEAPSGWSPQENDRIAGAMPNEMTSASESNCTPNSLAVPVIRAMRPSSMSSTMRTR